MENESEGGWNALVQVATIAGTLQEPLGRPGSLPPQPVGSPFSLPASAFVDSCALGYNSRLDGIDSVFGTGIAG